MSNNDFKTIPSTHTTSSALRYGRCMDAVTTSALRYGRCMDAVTTLCVPVNNYCTRYLNIICKKDINLSKIINLFFPWMMKAIRNTKQILFISNLISSFQFLISVSLILIRANKNLCPLRICKKRVFVV